MLRGRSLWGCTRAPLLWISIIVGPSSVLRSLAQATQEKGLSPVETTGEHSQQALWAASVLQ